MYRLLDLSEVKHMPGRHDQKTHGGKGGSTPRLDSSITMDKRAAVWMLTGVVDDTNKEEIEAFVDSLGSIYFSKSIQVAYKKKIIKELSYDTGIPENDMSEFIRRWADTSNDNDYGSLLAQESAAKEFGVELSDWQKNRSNQVKQVRKLDEERQSLGRKSVSPFEDEMGVVKKGVSQMYTGAEDATRETLRTMYDNTQAELKKAGIKTMTVYRGVQYEAGKEGEIVKLSGNALESWSLHPGVAVGFASGGVEGGTVFKMDVPASRIVGSCKTGYGCLNEMEVVVLGGKDVGDAMVLSPETVYSNLHD